MLVLRAGLYWGLLYPGHLCGEVAERLPLLYQDTALETEDETSSLR